MEGYELLAELVYLYVKTSSRTVADCRASIGLYVGLALVLDLDDCSKEVDFESLAIGSVIV